MPKQSIRRRLLQQRRSLQVSELASLGLDARQKLLALEEYVSARTVALYAPVHNEVDTWEIFSQALSAGKTVVFPAVTSAGLEFRSVAGKEELVPGSFGIFEPLAGCRLYDPADIDFFLVPGVAFDLCCRRVGYGKGYYDRALHQLEGSGRLAGFCYDFQILEEIPVSSHDVQMDLVITDRRVILKSGQFI